MDWLSSLDTGLFHFINGKLINPVFDAVMPLLSGNILFVPFLILAICLSVWRYRVKGILCVAIIALLVPLGDSYVCSTIKKAVGRPRPFVTLTDARQPPGVGKASSYSSMPSSHAANWFCATMIAWIYFRRSVWITLPFAFLVSFSRIYNGVHYPGDVFAGAILGAAYGFIGLYMLESVWRWAGKKYFPIWHAALPTLIPIANVPVADPKLKVNASPALIDQHWLRAGYALIIIFTFARWIYIASGIIELSQDEAYQWQWSKHLALSYYSKPPLIAYTQFLGTSIWGDNEFGVRFFSPLIAGTLGILLLRFFAREVNARTGFYLVLCVMAAPLLSVGATLMTVDPLSVLFWTAAMFAGWKAMQPNGTLKQWCWVGLWMGLGLLSKYTALFQLLCWLIFFVLWKPARVHLKRPGPWVAILINIAFFLPVIIWNIQHDWITVTHVAGNAGMEKPWPPPPLKIAEFFFTFLGQEFGLLNPVFFVSFVWAACAFWKSYRDDARQVYFFSMGAPVFIIYLAWTFHSRVLPNWIAPSILPLFCLMAIYWEKKHREGAPQVVPSLVCGLILGFVVILFLHDTNLVKKATGFSIPEIVRKFTDKPVSEEVDPMSRLSGWQNSADAVGKARKKLLAEGKPVFVIGSHYGITSLVSFYLPEAKAGIPDHPLAYYRTSSRIENQYYFWPGYEDRKGENAIYVTEGINPVPPTSQVLDQFESVTELPPVTITTRGRPFHVLRLYECRNLR